VGGSLVVATLAGVFYVLVAGIASRIYSNDQYWEHNYFYAWFIGLLVFYLFLPRVFAALVGGAVGSTRNRKVV